MRRALLALLGCLILAAPASAAWLRYHYVPANGPMVLQPSPFGTPGEVITLRGRRPYPEPPRPTCNVPFVHPCSRLQVLVPLELPQDVPVIEHRGDWVIYNYGSFSVQVHFLTDGAVHVIYNSGLLRQVKP